MGDKIIRFERGIPGFLEEKEFIYLEAGEGSPFGFLQSVRNEALAFIVVSPFLFFKDYEFALPEEVRARLELETEEDAVVLTIVTLGKEIKDSTANLIGPIVINLKNFKGEQIILEDKRYTTRHRLFQHIPEAIGGE
jgi:flagellar assembly factor FliW